MKKQSAYTWISLALLLFFWVPLLNVLLILPGSIFCGLKAIFKAKKNPDKHGTIIIPAIAIIFGLISFTYSLIILVLNSSGKI